MKLIFLIGVVVLCATCGFCSDCHTNPSCFYRKSWCDYAKSYRGLKWYNKCLESLCSQCNLCGVCDGENRALRATQIERFNCVDEHNRLRGLHLNTNSVKWDRKLSEEAQTFAESLVNTVRLKHSKSGENLFLKIGSNGTTVDTCVSATRAWYNEVQHFNWTSYDTTIPGKSINHFAQVVWKPVQKIGVGIAVHKKTKFVYVVLRYDVPVVTSTIHENVMPLKSE